MNGVTKIVVMPKQTNRSVMRAESMTEIRNRLIEPTPNTATAENLVTLILTDVFTEIHPITPPPDRYGADSSHQPNTMSKTKDAAIDAMNDTVPVTFHVPRPPDGWEIPNPMRLPKEGKSFRYIRSLDGIPVWSEPTVADRDFGFLLDVYAYPKVDPNQADWYDRIDALNLKDCWVFSNALYCFVAKNEPYLDKEEWRIHCNNGFSLLPNWAFNAPIWHGDWEASRTQVVNGKAVRP